VVGAQLGAGLVQLGGVVPVFPCVLLTYLSSTLVPIVGVFGLSFKQIPNLVSRRNNKKVAAKVLTG
jgi:hypothetical protein